MFERRGRYLIVNMYVLKKLNQSVMCAWLSAPLPVYGLSLDMAAFSASVFYSTIAFAEEQRPAVHSKGH